MDKTRSHLWDTLFGHSISNILCTYRNSKNMFVYMYITPQYLSIPMIYNTWGKNIRKTPQNYS